MGVGPVSIAHKLLGDAAIFNFFSFEPSKSASWSGVLVAVVSHYIRSWLIAKTVSCPAENNLV